MRTRSLIALLFSFLLVACDAWPTKIDNRTTNKISFRYLDRNLDYWSASLSVKPGYAITLARGYWIADIRRIEITDADKIYSWADNTILKLSSGCPGSNLPLREFFVGDCVLIYVGNGRLRAMPANLLKLRSQPLKDY